MTRREDKPWANLYAARWVIFAFILIVEGVLVILQAIGVYR